MMHPPRYRRFSDYLRQRFGGPVRKISLDAGFTCPNRDGRFSSEGCTFCLPPAFSPASGPQRLAVAEQLRSGLARGRGQNVQRFIAYFQAYTNTYASLDVLRQTYDTIRVFPEIKMLAIGTRPDCVDEAILAMIAGYAPDYEVWIEYGLQSANNATLQRINRGHDRRAFERAVELTRRFPAIKICSHVILGLPGEDAASETVTADLLAQYKMDGVKLHPLHVVRNTRLEAEYRSGAYQPLSVEAYATRAADFLERLWPETVIQRLTADCPADLLVAPAWIREKPRVLKAIEDCLLARDSRQGIRFRE